MLAASIVPDQPAAASCVAPAVTFRPGRVTRGAVLTITGKYFGDDCLDTGTLPPGVGALGNPLTGIVIVIDQGSLEFVVANGSADDDYSFQVDVVVPAGLAPGEASINVLAAGDARLTIDPPLVISSASPIGSDVESVAAFGPPTTAPELVDSVPPVVLPADIPDEPAATAPPLSTAPIEPDDNTSRQRAISAGFAGVVAIAAIGYAWWRRSKRRR